MSAPVVQPTADVAASAEIGEGSAIWHLAQVREGARIGRSCVVGRGAYIGSDVVVGDHSKIQNYALVYEPASLGAGVFVGPGAILTNDAHPRAVNPDGSAKTARDWHPVGVTVDDGASIGAAATCVAPLHVGRWATVAAGAVVVKDVLPFALVAGVPARRIGWVGRAGVRLAEEAPGVWVCPSTGDRHREIDGRLMPEEE